mmetsp:Transcript_2319/g.3540  ORF Transcript_2319/g.3540 Transcript_2319/m.3540 type:complete len:568 (+) Transcript_2319:224-1927(+)|eukprot:CAMPEP_0195296380 /NCGR_PEP_ID=MMETSP0707-20130614/19312_1 /TAXON_ID=33640 /ORGANISM="Asterionellopsis glacialis, Strain CCMP134" /LENGTH=567 /DNA_ID=CAMNT_0040357867 /DNA_START=166 /DNA_END=1869 /DNA_ORIENTATION=+
MGKLTNHSTYGRPNCSDGSAPICPSECCTISANEFPKKNIIEDHQQEQTDEIKELLVIGAGPHALSLLLRLLEPEADFLSDKDRHVQAEFKTRMRPISEVNQHIRKLSRGPSVTLKPSKKKKHPDNGSPPPLELEEVRSSVVVVDRYGGWLSGWKQNFNAIGIPKLRSLMNAHADPYDHRALEYYAEKNGRGSELITLPSLLQRNKDFTGPYQVPSTALFHDFHDLLTRAYGIEDIVQTGSVQSIKPIQDNEQSEEPIFEVRIDHGENSDQPLELVKARRIVCAMGPIFRTGEAFWEASLRKELAGQYYPSDKILHANEIIPYLRAHQNGNKRSKEPLRRILIVGGGITSAQLALLASKSPWCRSVTLIQRSEGISRHFDLETKWMGPRRGQLLDDFWSLDMHARAKQLQQARLGGSVPPEICQELLERGNLQIQKEVQISEVKWTDDQFLVTVDDGSDSEQYDMIWLATGSENHIDHYSALSQLRQTLPVEVVNGLPVLSKDLTWRCPPIESAHEPKWKKIARGRFHCMGSLAGLELGPDALNLVGARHGAVRVAKAIRSDLSIKK